MPPKPPPIKQLSIKTNLTTTAGVRELISGIERGAVNTGNVRVWLPRLVYARHDFWVKQGREEPIEEGWGEALAEAFRLFANYGLI